jgi:FtsP/CotA-like multicopper oxidase with cupredoxin domain
MTPSTGAEPMPSKPAGHRDSAAAVLSIRDAEPGTHDRRAFLKGVGHAGLAAASARTFGAGLLGSGFGLLRSDRAGAGREPLIQPPEIRSRNGVLDATLVASQTRMRLGEYEFPGFLYNDSYLAPLLRVRLGDVMRVRLQNHLSDDPTNLHFHGLNVSPRARADNVFINVRPDREFAYEVPIPAAGRQGPGLFWYHPHLHGRVNKQMLGGMAGGLVVDGAEALFPLVKDLPERFFLIKHAQPGGGREVISVNGQINPVVDIRPGEMQFWRIANVGASLFFPFKTAGMPLYVIATDGHPLSRPRKLSEFFIGPGQRIDAIAIGPPAGEYLMATMLFKNMAWRDPFPAQPIATIVSAGPRTAADAETEVLRQRYDRARWIDEVRASPIARRRRIVYSRTEDRSVFMIDGRVIDDDRVDQTVKLGDTEEWTVVNTDQQYHSFHIHQTSYLLTEVNGVPQDEDSLRDTVPLPPATEQGPSVTKVVIPFTDPEIVGRFVYHCHAVDHEDKGMMGIVEVVA